MVISLNVAGGLASEGGSPMSNLLSHVITRHPVDRTIISILFFFLRGKTQIQAVVNLSARRRNHRLTTHISPNAEYHQQSNAQVNQRIRAQTRAHSVARRENANRIRANAAAQPADRIHHADRRRSPSRPDPDMQRGPDVRVIHPLEITEADQS